MFMRKFECIHYKTQTGTSCEKCNSKVCRLGIEPESPGLLAQCSIPIPLYYYTTELYRSRCRQLGREFSIYIDEMVMPVKYKGIMINNNIWLSSIDCNMIRYAISSLFGVNWYRVTRQGLGFQKTIISLRFSTLFWRNNEHFHIPKIFPLL